MRNLRIARFAVQALALEAELRDKPGLVGPGHSGAHEDMDYALFLRSARSLSPIFRGCAAAGRAFAEEASGARCRAEPPVCGDQHPLLFGLRPLGEEGERRMLAATGGVNTHKGALFSLGLLSAAAAWVLGEEGRGKAATRNLGDRICLRVARMCSGLVESELGRKAYAKPSVPVRGRTAGERFYMRLGVRGARGEAEDGYPLVRVKLLPRLREIRGLGNAEGVRIARLDALLLSIAELEDTCLLSRGGHEGLEAARRGASEVLKAGGAGAPEGAARLLRLDAEVCAAGLSPGGSADMLAAALFLDSLERAAAESAALEAFRLKILSFTSTMSGGECA